MRETIEQRELDIIIFYQLYDGLHLSENDINRASEILHSLTRELESRSEV